MESPPPAIDPPLSSQAVPAAACPSSDSPDSSKPTLPTESRAREYLSNERTYLSWMRTAISLLGIGVILGRMHRSQPSAAGISMTWQLGIIFAIVGLITVYLATQHYLAIRRAIADDTDTADRWVILLSIATVLFGSGIVYYVLVYGPNLL